MAQPPSAVAASPTKPRKTPPQPAKGPQAPAPVDPAAGAKLGHTRLGRGLSSLMTQPRPPVRLPLDARQRRQAGAAAPGHESTDDSADAAIAAPPDNGKHSGANDATEALTETAALLREQQRRQDLLAQRLTETVELPMRATEAQLQRVLISGRVAWALVAMLTAVTAVVGWWAISAVGTAQGQVQTLGDQIAQQRTQNTELRQQLGQAAAAAQQLASQRDQLRDELAATSSALNAANATIDGMEASLHQLQAGSRR